VEAASFALVQRNYALALDLIAQLEVIARDRESAVPMPGPYWKLKAFRKAHLGHIDEARGIVRLFAECWKHTCPYHYLDILAVKAWLELNQEGRLSEETDAELGIFDDMEAVGRRTLLALQGFLQPRKTHATVPKTTGASGTARATVTDVN
jgi:hypothetical protein